MSLKNVIGMVGSSIVSRELSLLLLVHLNDINFTHRFPYRLDGGRVSTKLSLLFLFLFI